MHSDRMYFLSLAADSESWEIVSCRYLLQHIELGGETRKQTDKELITYWKNMEHDYLKDKMRQ